VELPTPLYLLYYLLYYLLTTTLLPNPKQEVELPPVSAEYMIVVKGAAAHDTERHTGGKVRPICMPYMSALYVCLRCMPYMYALYVCLRCMPYMYAL